MHRSETMQKLRVASCQFPVTEDIERNAEYIAAVT